MNHFLKLLLISLCIFFNTYNSHAQSKYLGDTLYNKGRDYLVKKDYVQAAINLTAYKVYYILTRDKKVDKKFVEKLNSTINFCNRRISQFYIRKKIDNGAGVD